MLHSGFVDFIATVVGGIALPAQGVQHGNPIGSSCNRELQTLQQRAVMTRPIRIGAISVNHQRGRQQAINFLLIEPMRFKLPYLE